MQKQKRKLNLFKDSRGGIEIIILLIIFVASIFIVGGIFPKLSKTDPNAEKFTAITGIPLDSHNSLQLKTIKFKKCLGQTNVDLLLDRTGSMGERTPTGQTKIARLKEAVLVLTGQLSDQSVVGIQSFSSESITDDVPISYYKDVKGIISSKVNALNAGGQTPTHDALAFSLDRLKEAIPKFPGRQFNFILISDGQPVPPSQDPRLFNPNPADEIKNLRVNVYTLGIFTSGEASEPKLAELLKSIASRPENYYEAQTGDQATKLLEAILTKICEQTN
ncbi:MAG: hypothetical protein A2958_02240 [Candidatus Levybacteria bacterium RIFCSPLOWO2_01_FULL_38_13]|nr:MAG: hypothetical protein A2629_03870 [Candidatus Levybacteria bacterium RIFCSPHIGHO2_01_FULL_41_15]OGH35069.1 MAG: hypothetical protein A2958_02240 [Candidatus Levybacteria bacterium RIFCSPLOWO2_01_FULL_38_13]